MKKNDFKMTEQNIYSYMSPDNIKVEVFLSPLLFEYLEESSLKQLLDASELPGVIPPVIGMPDIHEGFGLPIGGVLATDGNDGIISAGAVGMDINCGVRLINTDIDYGDIKDELPKLLEKITSSVSPGVGGKTKYLKAKSLDIQNVLEQGVPYLIRQGFGNMEDLDHIEDGGVISEGDSSVLSHEAVKRAKEQLATLGSGNHFIEICLLETDFNQKEANDLGINYGKVCFLIHTGSRGIGHQVCTEYMDRMKKALKKDRQPLPTKGLAYAEIKSPLGREYFSAMAAASNFAFANRQLLTTAIEEAIGCKTNLIYDVPHNIAKFETIDNQKLLVHRKGATRAFPAGHSALAKKFKNTGQPVIIPGTMGTGSYIMLGTENLRRTFYSVNHGAGRQLSRKQAKKSITKKQFKQMMNGIEMSIPGVKNVIDEAPQAYKDVDEVVNTLCDIGLTKKIARLRPIGVIKG
ncbi:RtcB family protein [Natranaerobius thermophilus]|uniref:tRNA-splicing ligase RtcB n=1 Tax=Natranaerobius thermophilus (strain ATCC BAA-1301 / DSM 18059 / JW/NM-WN-LF) TaxID=457570 RepID=B2A4A0_NATTJ|nr:RtcB family protein [Natranaerobius thermophilus]ACB83754.1 protein of unknown function UPF0027 [Natranaerobius thermophilus JW/NM-WN-LF]